MEWHYADNAGKQVKFDESEFPKLVSNGTILSTTLVWNPGMSGWQAASEVRPEQFTSDYSSSPYLAPKSPVLPAQGQVVSQQDPTSGLQTAALVCGILSITCLGILTGIPAVICGHMARSRKLDLTGSKEGTGMALAGLIMGYLIIAGTLAYVIFFVVVGLTGAFDEASQP